MWIKHEENILTEAVLRQGVDILSKCLVNEQSVKSYIDRCDSENLKYPLPKISVDPGIWNIPAEYKSLNIEEYLIDICPKENYDRLAKEFELYHKNEMIPVLQAMKYIVDTLRKNNIVWGVGRGSSVASYVLYLIGVHKIDSVKYNLPIEEFFKGVENG
jgi:DNA polymerase III alpha subunit